METTRLIPILALPSLTCGWCQTQGAATFDMLTNHPGYDSRRSKRLVGQSAEPMEPARFQATDNQGRVAFEGPLQEAGTVADWKGGFFRQGDLLTLEGAVGSPCRLAGPGPRG